MEIIGFWPILQALSGFRASGFSILEFSAVWDLGLIGDVFECSGGITRMVQVSGYHSHLQHIIYSFQPQSSTT